MADCRHFLWRFAVKKWVLWVGFLMSWSCLTQAQSIDFSFPDRDGKTHNLSDFRGNYVFVDFWASWCVPCLAQIPHLKKFESENHYDNLVVVGISLDDDKADWIDALNKEQPLGVQLFNEQGFDAQIIAALNVVGLPRFALLGPNGELVNGDMPMPGDEDFKSTIEAYLKATN
ncbi:TlpA family protein disulfide reductase [bacterium SCSIO 12696]|nr:TlpA family protein disulfide reductase [bacterium SCSIO 12696]